MTTALTAVLDGKMNDDQLGMLHRRVDEIKRRINEDTISYYETVAVLQIIIEGKTERLKPCARRHRSEPLPFVRPPIGKRKKSKAPMRLRLPEFLQRLYFNYRTKIFAYERWNKMLTPEDIMAQMWEAENIPEPWHNQGRVPVQTILGNDTPPDREVMILSSTLQWLGTNQGRDFLVRFIRAADITI